MASISRDPGGRRRILFVAADGNRKAIRLGKVPQKMAEIIKTKVEALVMAAITSTAPDDETSRWVANLDTIMADKQGRRNSILRQTTVVLRQGENRTR